MALLSLTFLVLNFLYLFQFCFLVVCVLAGSPKVNFRIFTHSFMTQNYIRSHSVQLFFFFFYGGKRATRRKLHRTESMQMVHATWALYNSTTLQFPVSWRKPTIGHSTLSHSLVPNMCIIPLCKAQKMEEKNKKQSKSKESEREKEETVPTVKQRRY